MARYADLKQERDDAMVRALEAERYSMRTEVDRIRAECAEEVATANRERDRANEKLGKVIETVSMLAGEFARDVRGVLDRQESEG